MTLTPQIYLSFDGRCEAALRFYAEHLGGTVVFMTWGESPLAGLVPPDWGVKIVHATLKIGDIAIAGADSPPDQYERPQGFSIMLAMDDPAAAERVFNTLSEEGTVQLALQETFWAARYGAVVDRFGIPWTINCEGTKD